jgi:hypothetical protein
MIYLVTNVPATPRQNHLAGKTGPHGKRKGFRMKDPVAKAILAHFAGLPDHCTSVTVTSLEADLANVERPRPQIIRFLRHLEEKNWGTFKTGRRGRDSRFESPHGLKKIGRQLVEPASPANQESYQSKDGQNVEVPSNGVAGAPLAEESRSQDLKHQYLLRPNYPLTIILPVDLTTGEANRLADFIKSLPFH